MTPVVAYADAEPSGLATIIGGLIEQNLARDPARRRLLRPSLISIEAPDAGVGVTVRIDPDGVLVIAGADPRASVAVVGDSDRLLALTAAPLRFGMPDPMRAEGRAVIGDIVCGRVRVRGMISHPRRLVRLTMLLSVR